MKQRACQLGLCPPTKIIFGREYGVCPFVQECPDTIVCGYAMTRQIMREADELNQQIKQEGS